MNKRNLILAVALVCLVGFYTLGNKKTNNKEESVKVLPNKEEIKELKIVKKDEEIDLKKEENKWYLEKPEKYKADQKYVNDIIDTLNNLELKDVISSSKNDYAKYDVDEENGIEVEVLDKKLVIGKSSSDYMKNFVKYGDKVYIADTLLKYKFDKTSDNLKDKSIVDFEDKKIVGLTIKGENTEKILTLKENKWFEGEKEIKNVNSFLDNLSKLKLSDFQDNQESESEDIFSIDLKYEDKSIDKIEFAFGEENKINGKSTYNDLHFAINKNRVEKLKKFEFE